MLSRDCDGCERQNSECKRRFAQVSLGEKFFVQTAQPISSTQTIKVNQLSHFWQLFLFFIHTSKVSGCINPKDKRDVLAQFDESNAATNMSLTYIREY